MCRHHAKHFREHRRSHPDALVAPWAAQQPPYLAPHQFSLLPLPELLRLEVLYGLQQAEPWLRVFEPAQVRRMVRDLAGTVTLVSAVTDEQMCPRSTVAVLRLLTRIRTAVQAAYAECTGTAPAQDDILDLRALGQRSRTPAGIRTPKTVDLRTIRQRWLRDLLRTWTIQQRPGADEFGRTLRGVELASRALAPRPGTDDPTRLRYDDVTAVVEAFRTALKLDGEPAGWNYRMSIASHFFALIDYSRRSGTTENLSAAFVRDPATHRIAQEEANEDEIGKAIPEPVIRQLDAHLDLLGQGKARGQRTLTPADLQLMYQTLYILLRDTGRRPLEVLSLPLDCLETRNDQISLIWNNHKTRRYRRRLPITTSTAEAIRTWRARRDQLQPTLPPAGTDFLFPALTHLATRPYLHTSYLGETLRHWVDSIPHLHDEGADPHGNPLPFDRALIYAYAFRHSYAQRHADAGTPLDVLRELMDHKSVSTTQRYYTVSLKRKRDAVTKLSAHVVDNHGRPSPCSESAYELRSVAVPYGGLHRTQQRQSRRQLLPHPLPMRRLRLLPPRPLLPHSDRTAHQRTTRRPRNSPGHGRRRIRHHRPHRPDQRLRAGHRSHAPPTRSPPRRRTPGDRRSQRHPAQSARRHPHPPAPHRDHEDEPGMNPHGNAHTLVQARRRDSLDKRQRTLTALTTLEQQGKKITHTAVARTAGVSTWLTYTEGIREHIEAAQQRQQPKVTRPADTRTPNATLRTELELARQEVRDLREEKERMRQALRNQLGQQLDGLGTKDLAERVDHLARDNQRLQDALRQATEDNHALHSQVTSLEADLGAARTSLRRMIREENRSP
ncbi:DUF6262 family protein [Streptomyces sp. NPDC001919]